MACVDFAEELKPMPLWALLRELSDPLQVYCNRSHLISSHHNVMLYNMKYHVTSYCPRCVGVLLRAGGRYRLSHAVRRSPTLRGLA